MSFAVWRAADACWHDCRKRRHPPGAFRSAGTRDVAVDERYYKNKKPLGISKKKLNWLSMSGRVKNLLWMHAFERQSLQDKLDTLTRGRYPSHRATSTSDAERILKIAGPCVYAYLGRTHECFGNTAFAVGMDAPLDAELTPFDTGGLIAKIRPICGRDDTEKVQYLLQYTWPYSEARRLIERYPTLDDQSVRSYLDARRPPVHGPHVYWAGEIQAEIWKQNSDWRVWTWELRAAGGLITGENIRLWTCPAADYAAIQKYAEDSDDDVRWLSFLTERYVQGGVSALIKQAGDL